MIRLNVQILMSDDSKAQQILEAATELVELSMHDEGCIDYDLYRSTTNDDRLLIFETWRDAKALKAHEETEHFKRIVPQLQELGVMTLERFDF